MTVHTTSIFSFNPAAKASQFSSKVLTKEQKRFIKLVHSPLKTTQIPGKREGGGARSYNKTPRDGNKGITTQENKGKTCLHTEGFSALLLHNASYGSHEVHSNLHQEPPADTKQLHTALVLLAKTVTEVMDC